jgi:hypothetical protein
MGMGEPMGFEWVKPQVQVAIFRPWQNPWVTGCYPIYSISWITGATLAKKSENIYIDSGCVSTQEYIKIFEIGWKLIENKANYWIHRKKNCYFSNVPCSRSIFNWFQIFLYIPGCIHSRYLHKYFQIFWQGFPPLIHEIKYIQICTKATWELPSCHLYHLPVGHACRYR